MNTKYCLLRIKFLISTIIALEVKIEECTRCMTGKKKDVNYAPYYNYDCHEVGIPTFKTISYLMTLVSYDSCKRDPKQNNPVKYVLEIKSEVSAKMIGEVTDIVFDNKVKHLC